MAKLKDRSSHQRCSLKKRPATKFLRTPFLQNTSSRLLLKTEQKKHTIGAESNFHDCLKRTLVLIERSVMTKVLFHPFSAWCPLKDVHLNKLQKAAEYCRNYSKIMNRPQLKITPGALVCNEAEIIGDVTIGVRTVIHPKASIIAEKGPIIVGDGNLIEEQSKIVNTHPGHTMVIGHSNVFEIGTRVEAKSIGSNNVFEAKTFIGSEVEVTNGCVVGAMCRVDGCETLLENTVIYGQNNHRRKAAEKPPPQMLQLDFLSKILPNYHHLKGRGK